MLAMLLVGYFFHRRNKSNEDFYVGGRKLGKWHIGFSVVATDVGGGFSIGLGGLGFVIGLSGSWMLFTGLVGAWISAVFLIPRVIKLSKVYKFTTFPQIFNHFYGKNVALIAGFISAIGYMGFTSSQILAGGKLASATFEGLSIENAVLIMGIIAIVYTALGGLKAVIYTDTIQWMILMFGLIFVGIPISIYYVGGYEVILKTLPDEYFALSNVKWQDLVKWGVTILPIWFVGMTLYQRIYASKSEKEAKKAWFIAGLFEYPVMAFIGVIFGLIAQVAFQQNLFEGLGKPVGSEIDPEIGLPLLLRTALPIGVMGLIMAAYFSAIMSTADSCLIASSGNILTDIINRWVSLKHKMWISQLLTFAIGAFALILAISMENVLELMLYSYAFMVSGLFVPLVAAIFFNIRDAIAAMIAMLLGGIVTVVLSVGIKTEVLQLPLDLDANIFGICSSILSFVLVYVIRKYFHVEHIKQKK